MDISNYEKTAIIVIAYNEGKVIKNVLEDLSNIFNGQIIVVNDGSIDNTEEEIKKITHDNKRIHLLNHLINLGPFMAIHTGLQCAINLDHIFFVNFDGDGQHAPKYIPKLLESVFNEEVDLVIGSRFLENSDYKTTKTRNFGIKGSSKAVSIFGKTRITDVNSGYRAYNLKCANKMLEQYNRISTVFEFTLRFCRDGYKVKEIPVKMESRKYGKSYLSMGRMLIYPFRIIFNILKALV